MSAGSYVAARLLSDPFYLVGYRVLLVWLHERAKSLLLVVLVHVAVAVGAMTLTKFAKTPGTPLLTFDLAWAAATWAAFAAIAVTSRGRPGAPAADQGSTAPVQ